VSLNGFNQVLMVVFESLTMCSVVCCAGLRRGSSVGALFMLFYVEGWGASER